MHRRSFLSGLGLSPLAAVAAFAAPAEQALEPRPAVANGVCDVEVWIDPRGDEYVRRLVREGTQQAIEQYHEAQERGGFGRAMADHLSRRG